MCARVAEKFEAVSLWTGQRVLMTENNARGIFFETPRTNKSAARAPFSRARHGEFLRVRVKRRRSILSDQVLRFPIVERGGGAGINIVARAVTGIFAALFDGDEIGRVGVVIFLLHFRRNFVVGLGEDVLKWRELRIVAECAKRENLGHEISKSNFEYNGKIGRAHV